MRISEYNAPIAENIERIINEKGLKKAFVAQKAGCTAQMLSDMISGRKIIKACDIVRIAGALGVDPNYLLAWKVTSVLYERQQRLSPF